MNFRKSIGWLLAIWLLIMFCAITYGEITKSTGTRDGEGDKEDPIGYICLEVKTDCGKGIVVYVELLNWDKGEGKWRRFALEAMKTDEKGMARFTIRWAMDDGHPKTRAIYIVLNPDRDNRPKDEYERWKAKGCEGKGDKTKGPTKISALEVKRLKKRGQCWEVGGDPPIYKNIQAFPTPERFMGQDLNGDGDISDTVLRYMNIETGEVVNTGAIASGATHSVDIYENIIAFARIGLSVRYYDISTGTFGDTGARGSHPSIYEDIITFSSGGRIHYYDVRTQTLVNTTVAGLDPAIYKKTIAFESDGTIRYFDLRTGTSVDTGIVGGGPALYENLIVFQTPEYRAEQDLNGDGDTTDSVIRYYDISTGALINTGAIGLFPAIHGNTIAFTTIEFAVDQDLDGDGEIRSHVIRYYDIASGTVVNTGKAGTEPEVYENTISVYTWERWVAQDLNGDGDTSDPIVQYCRTAPIQEAIAATTDE